MSTGADPDSQNRFNVIFEITYLGYILLLQNLDVAILQAIDLPNLAHLFQPVFVQTRSLGKGIIMR